VTAPELHHLPSTYKGFPSLMLLVLRFVVIALMAIRVWLDTKPLADTVTMWQNTVLPDTYARPLAYAQVAVEAAIVVLLLFGLGTRLVGLLLVALAAAWLVFILWGVGSPFDASGFGVAFTGEFEVLLIGVGLVFLGLGGGGWLSLDSFFHRARVERKNQHVS
jgi:uncharacterized membrane protein YphA (DoxX/SURF4 family)